MARRSIRFEEAHLVPALNLISANKAFVTDAAGSILVLQRPRDFALRDWVIYLLHNAAEVEHTLMVQYLFAMYSLNPQARNPNNTPSASTTQWAQTISQIAIEEMGHLLTVQNILRFVGGPLCFEREDFPIPTNIYPFTFELEPLSKNSLAKYVFAEMPAHELPEEVITHAERSEIEARARTAAGVKEGAFLNHVGILYATLIDAFADPLFNDPQTAGFPHNAEKFQHIADDFESEGNDSISAPRPQTWSVNAS